MNTITYNFTAYAFAENFDLKTLGADLGGTSLSLMDPRACLTKQLKNGGTLFAYNFGALCFVNTSPTDIENEIKQLRMKREGALSPSFITDDFIVEENPNDKPHAEFSKLVLDKALPQRIEVVALTVAQSAAISYYESTVIKVHAKVLKMVEKLGQTGKADRKPKKLHKFIAEAIEMRSEIVGVLHLLDRPDLIWDDKVMDTLYSDLRTVFDLQERFDALVYKLDYIQQTMELLLDVARDSRGFLLEFSILLLIFVELALSLIKGFH